MYVYMYVTYVCMYVCIDVLIIVCMQVWAPSDSFTTSQIQNYRSAMSVLSVPLGQDNALADTGNLTYDDSSNPNLIADSGGSNSSSSGSTNASSNAFMHCLHILCGHESAVSAISYSSDMDLIVSGSKGSRP